MHRRKYLTALSGSLGHVSLSGCLGVLPTDSGKSPEYPGGTLVVENTANSSLKVRVSVGEGTDAVRFNSDIPAGETVIEREFVTAPEGEVVRLSAVIGRGGNPTSFEFFPGGGVNDAPPEVAHLTLENAVEESATWSATARTG